MIQKGKGLADLFKNITRPLAPVLNPVFKEVETITRPLKPVLNPILKEAKGIGTAVGVNLADGLLQDLIAGKSSKASAKARGQQTGLNAKNMATARVLQALGQNGNGFPGGSGDPLIALDSDFEENIAKPKQPSTKRKRTQSASQPPAKRKQTRKKTQKGGQLKNRKKRTQTGGFGLGGLIGSMYHGFDRLEKKARKRVLKRIYRKNAKNNQGRNAENKRVEERNGDLRELERGAKERNVNPKNKREGYVMIYLTLVLP